MTINRDPDRGGTSMVAVAIVAIIAIGLLYMMFAGDRTTVVRDGVCCHRTSCRAFSTLRIAFGFARIPWLAKGV